jgi:hypothetical protein
VKALPDPALCLDTSTVLSIMFEVVEVPSFEKDERHCHSFRTRTEVFTLSVEV